MRIIYLIFIMLLTNLYSSEYADKINKYCTIKASVFTSERLYEHEYIYCSKTLMNKKLSIKEFDKMIESEPTKKEKIQRYQKSTQHLQQKIAQQKEKNARVLAESKKMSNTSISFDIHSESCYNLGMAFGACSIRSMNDMACELGTNFVIPVRCRGKFTTHKGIQDGAFMQKLLIQKGVYH